jgi:hypothetical protein
MNILERVDKYLNEAKTIKFVFTDELERNGFIGDMKEWGMIVKKGPNKGKKYFAEVKTKIGDKEELQAIADFADDHSGKKA